MLIGMGDGNILKTKEHNVREADTIKTDLSLAIEAVLDKKGLDLVVLDLRGISTFTDYFVIASGTSVRQTQAIADAVEMRLRAEKVRGSIEGYREGEWILLDYGDFLVHVFTQNKRDYFDLERLWGDAPRVAVEGAAEALPRRKRRALPDKL
jgi:ribosome-associated protein